VGAGGLVVAQWSSVWRLGDLWGSGLVGWQSCELVGGGPVGPHGGVLVEQWPGWPAGQRPVGPAGGWQPSSSVGVVAHWLFHYIMVWRSLPQGRGSGCHSFSSLVLSLSQVCLPHLSKFPDSWSSCSLHLCSSCHFGSSLYHYTLYLGSDCFLL
jgi:hypothetical protein